MVSRVIPVDVFDLVIFGGTGDLARRKILPGLFRRFLAGQMQPEARVIGAARSDQDDAAYREMIRAGDRRVWRRREIRRHRARGVPVASALRQGRCDG